jgi:hypothetical protein
MDHSLDFEQHLNHLSHTFLHSHPDQCRQQLEDLEFKTYTRPIQFNQLTQHIFELLQNPHSHYASNTFDLYLFFSNNFINLTREQQCTLAQIIEHDYQHYQQHDVYPVISEILGQKLANKNSLSVTNKLIQCIKNRQRAHIVDVLELHIKYAQSTAIKRQALHLLKSLTQDDERLVRSRAQTTLNHIMHWINPRIYRSICT